MGKNERMDAKRLKLLKTAIIKIREACNLMNGINIDTATDYDYRVLAITYASHPVDGESKVMIQLDSLTTLQQLYKKIEKGKPLACWNTFRHQSGDVTALCLVAKEEGNNND